MGASSRPDDFDFAGAMGDVKQTAAETLNYFVSYIEKWRVAFSARLKQELTGFVLAGHSFGGYQVGQYALRYPQHVTKLYLLSPVGIRIPPEGEVPLERSKRLIAEAQKDIDLPEVPLWAFFLLEHAWKAKLTPMKLCRFMGPKWTSEQLPLLLDACHLTTEPERSACHDYIYQLVMRKSTTELGFFNLFNNGCQAHFPLGEHTFEMPMSFIIGAEDWVLYCDRHDERNMHWGQILVETNQKKHGE